jgi:ectoine hydroxylase-related dioxygenase (phytanoyl-CoA dioxygenase family)
MKLRPSEAQRRVSQLRRQPRREEETIYLYYCRRYCIIVIHALNFCLWGPLTDMREPPGSLLVVPSSDRLSQIELHAHLLARRLFYHG